MTKIWVVRFFRLAIPALQTLVFVLNSKYNTTKCPIIAHTKNVIFRNPMTVRMNNSLFRKTSVIKHVTVSFSSHIRLIK